MDPGLDELRAQAALRSGLPTIVASAASEVGARSAREVVEGVVGAVPQAWLEEPFDDEPAWLLRCPLPGLGGAVWAHLHQRLRVEGVPCHLEHTDPPGVIEAIERGWLVAEVLHAGGLRARRLLAGDTDRRPDLVRPFVDEPWLHALEREVARAVRSVRADLVPTSERGPDTLAAIVHRPSGRSGVELYLPAEPADPLPDRVAVLAAIEPVVGALELCPDLEWDATLGGLTLRLWLAVAPGAPLPGDELVEGVASWEAADLVDHADHVEIQVLPEHARDHDRVVASVAALAERAGLGGGPSRWVRTLAGPCFAPTWLADHVPADELLEALRALPGVRAVRRVPGAPHGLQDAWPAVDPVWRSVAGVCFCRWPDAVPDRDRLERVVDRAADARDHEVADRSPLELRPIVDGSGRHGLEVRSDRRSLAEAGLEVLLAELAALRHPELSSLGSLGFARDGAVVRRWWRRPEPDPSKIRAWGTSLDA
ncbi:MAG: hypothetical protein H6735_23615 [Alphaproteobacteria bacterium]|nr:hypothetical protein [Alphaproteobacteria bacterium]